MKRLIMGDEGIGVRDIGPMNRIMPYVLERIDGLPPIEQRRELIRLIAGAQFESSFVRPGYRLSIALTTASISAPIAEVDSEVLSWLRATEAAWLEVMIDIFKGMADLLNLATAPGLDPDLAWPIFTTSVMALGEGLFARMSTSRRCYLLDIPGPGPNGTTEMWSLYGLAIDAMVERFFITCEA